MPRRFVVFLFLAVLSGSVPALVAAQESGDSEYTRVGGWGEGWGEGYWGPIPPPADSVRGSFRGNSMPVWEGMLVWPYRVLTFPVQALSLGVGAGVVALDDAHFIYHVRRFLAPRELPWGFRVNFTAGGLPGFGGGVTFFHNRFLGEGSAFELRAKGTLERNRKLTLGIRNSGSTVIQLGAGHRVQPNARYFGLGPETGEDDKSYFTLQQNWIGVSVNRPLIGPLSMETDILYSEIGARGPNDDEPSLRTAFAGDLPAGFGRTSDGLSASVSLISDRVAPGGRPEQGAYHRFKVARFDGTGDETAAFWTYRGEIQEFVPLWFSKRALAVRALITWIDPDRGTVVPFQRLMTNDDPDLLRGYRDFRWRDRGMVVGTAEYRWPIWVAKHADGFGVDGYLFTDIGQVFEKGGDIALNHLTESFGGGLRLVNEHGFLARLEIAASDEETVLRFRTDQVFQFSKGHLFHGRNPVPLR